MEKHSKQGLGRLWHIYNEALRAKCFIYHKEYKKWYTPEEFEEKYTAVELSNGQELRLIEELVIRDPIAGISAAHKQINTEIQNHKEKTDAALQKLNEFNKKVILYYQEKVGAKR